MKFLLVFVIVLAAAHAEEGNKRRRRQAVPLDSEPIFNNEIENEIIEEDAGVIDSLLGPGAQGRLVESVKEWASGKVRENPGCVERFICETYRTAESLDGFSYIVMSLTNSAVSFMVAEMFDNSINVDQLTKAARMGRTTGTCHKTPCEFLDGQLRSVGQYLETLEEFLSSIFNAVSNSLTIG